MQLSLPKDDLLNYVLKQLGNFFPDGQEFDRERLKKDFDLAIQRTEFCFSHINVRYFHNEGQTYFNHLNGDQYCMFLYYFCNTVYRNESDLSLAAKLFGLNKYLHGIDAFYEVELPDIFLVVHPLGTVLGRGKFANYFLVYQRCNIGANKGIYPVLEEFVSLHPGSGVIGSCRIGRNSKLSIGSIIMDKDLEEGSLYIGMPKDHIIKKSSGINPVWNVK